MDNFDMNNYLNRRLGNVGTSKTDSLSIVSKEKKQEIEDASWTKRLGENPLGLTGSAINTAASFVSGATRLGGQLASLIPNASAYGDESALTNEDVAAYNRYQKGIATPEDTARLAHQNTTAKVRGYDIEVPEEMRSSTLQLFERAINKRQLGRDINDAFDTSSIVDQTKRNQLNADLGENFQSNWDQTKQGWENNNVTDVGAGIAKLIYHAGEAAVTNPGASAEYIAENIPQLAVGAVGKAGMAAMTASNVGYGADIYRQGIESYQKQNNGELPSVEIRQQIAMDASKAIVAEQGGDLLGLGFMKAGKLLNGTKPLSVAEAAMANASIAGSEVAGKAATIGVDEVTRLGFKQALKNTAAAGVEGAITETGTEGYQTYLEGQANQKPATAQEIYTGAAIGGIAGSGMSAGGRALAEGAKATPEHAEKRVSDRQEAVKLVTAAESNDASAYSDPTKATFDPQKAMAILVHHAKSDTSTPESIQQNQDKASALLSDLEDQHMYLSMQSPDNLASIKESISTAQEQLKTATTPEQITQLEQSIAYNQESVAEIENMPAKQVKANAVALAKLETQLETVRNQKQQLDSFATPVDVESTVALATTAPDVQDTAAVEEHKLAIDKMINLSMTSPDQISEEVATNLAKNAGKTLTAQQQEHFSTLAQAKVAEREAKSMAQVSEDVLLGNSETKQLGLASYRSRITNAVSAGNQKVAGHYLKMLESFARGHTAKAGVFAQAYQEIQNQPSGTTMQLLPNKGVWAPATQQYSVKQMTRLGGLTIHNNSVGLVEAVAAEAKALRQGLKALKSSVAMKFTENTVANTPKVVAEATPEAVEGNSGQLQSNNNTVDPVISSTNTTVNPVTPEASKTEQDTADAVVAGDKATLMALMKDAEFTEDEINEQLQYAFNEGETGYYFDEGTETESNPPGNQEGQATTGQATKTEEASTSPVITTIPELLREMQPGYEDRFRTLNGKTEQPILDRVIEGIRHQFSKELATLRGVVVRYSLTKETVAAGTFYGKHSAISLSPETFSNVVEGLDDSPEERVMRVLVHELSHQRDKALGTVDADGRFVFASEELPAYNSGGKLYQEVLDAMAEDTPAGKLLTLSFEYILGKDSKLTSKQVPRELYAQLNTLYYLHSETMKNAIPESYRAIKEQQDTHETDTGRVDEAGLINDARTGESVVGEEKVSTDEGGSSTSGTGTSDTGLTVLAQYSEELASKPMQEVFNAKGFNPIAQFFKQSKVSERYAGTRPLVAMKDFLTRWSKDFKVALKFLPEDRLTLSDDEEGALHNLGSHMEMWMPKLKDTFLAYKGDARYKLADMMQYLLVETKDGVDTDENVKSAMAYGMYSWLVRKASSPTLMLPKQINTMLGRDGDEPIHPGSKEAPNEIYRLHAFEHTVANELGGNALDALGLKLREDSPPDLMARLKTAMGMHMIAALESTGHVRRDVLTSQEVTNLLDFGVRNFDKKTRQLTAEEREETEDVAEDAFDDGPERKYVSLVLDDKDNLSPEVKQIQKANGGTGGIIDALFGNEAGSDLASTTPIKYSQVFAKKTQQLITKLQHKAIKKTMNTPHTVNPVMYQMAMKLDREAFLTIAGKIDLEAGLVHAVNIPAVKAQNRNLERQYDLMMELLDKADPGQEFFVAQEVWKNYRAGFVTADLNMQTSKIHRGMFSKPSWNVKYDPTNPTEYARLIGEMKIAVAMNLGLVKTDQQTNVFSLAKFDEKLSSDPKLRKALDIIRADHKDDKKVWTADEVAAVTEVAANEGVLALQALTVYALYENSIEGGTPTEFSAEMLVGVDGKTNGPILTMLALGAAVSVEALLQEMERGGIYSTAEGKPEHYSQWYEAKGSQDLYENTADKVSVALHTGVKTPQEIADAKTAASKAKGTAASKLWAKAYSMYTQKHLDALFAVTGALSNGTKITSAGRNLVKTPITAFFFGSSLNRAVKAMEDNFIDSIYTAYEGLAKESGEGTVSEKQVNFLNQLNVLIGFGNSKLKMQINPQLPIETLMGEALDWKVEAALRSAFSKIMGKPVKGTFESKFEVLIKRRKALNETHAVNFATYSAIRDTMRQQEMERLVESGEIAAITSTSKLGKVSKKPAHDMLPSQEAAFNEKIKDVLPLVHTAMSLEEGNLDAGLFVAKDKATDSTNPLYRNEVQMKTVDAEGKTTETKRKASSMNRTKESPGVAGTAFQTHSLDASIMHNTVLAVDDVLNVHDEASGSIAAVQKIAQTINENTIEYLLSYSPAREALNTLERMIIGMDQKLQRKGITEEQVQDIFAQWAAIYNAKFFSEEDHISPQMAGAALLEAATQNAFAADVTRLQTISQIGNVDQYTWEGGQAKVSEELRERAKQQLAKVKNKPSNQALKAIARLNAAFDTKTDKVIAEPVSPTVKENKERQALLAQIPNRDVSWLENHEFMGELGTPKAKEQHDTLVDYLKTKEDHLGTDVLDHLLSADSKLNPAQRAIAKRVKAVLDPKFVLKYLSSTTKADAVLNGPNSYSLGWYVGYPTEAGGFIHEGYILGTDFAQAQVKYETVLHELVHAALSQIIADDSNPATDALVKEMSALMLATKNSLYKIAEKTALGNGQYQKYKRLFFTDANGKPKTEFTREDIQEFVAYGLTDPVFQNVLKNVKYQTKTAKEAFTGFLNAVLEALFGKGRASEGISTGMEALLTNVSGMFELAGKTTNYSPVSLKMAANASTHTTQAIYETLDGKGISNTFDAKLTLLLGTLVQSIHGNYGSLGQVRMEAQAMTPRDIWERAEQDGVVPFASQSLAAGFNISEKEAFVLEQVEVTIKSALDSNTSTTTVAYNELAKLYREAQRKFTAKDFYKGDWATATPSEIKTAESLHAFIFKIEQGADNRSDYLARFAALGLTHEGFNTVLQQATDTVGKAQADEKIGARLERWFHQLMEMLTGRLTKTYAGQHADTKLEALVTQLVGIEAKRISAESKPSKSLLQPLEDGVNYVSDSIRSSVEKIGRSDFIRNKTPTAVAATGAILSTIAGNRVEIVMEHMTRLRDKHFKEGHAFVAGVIDEVRGTTEHNANTHEALRLAKHREGERKTLSVHTGNTLLNGFAEEGKKLSQDQRAAITAALLRTEAFSLLGTFSKDELEGILRNPKILERHIATLEKRVAGLGVHQHFYVKAAKLLGYQMATGEVRGDHVLLNAHNIANMFGTQYGGTASLQQREAAEALIDPLVSLYALRYTAPRHMAFLKQVLDIELPRGKDNGISLVLQAHQAMQKESKERIFVDGEVLMKKGYAPEILDPNVDMLVANAFDGAKLVKMGYAKGGKVTADPRDPDQSERHIYVVHGGGQVAYLSGAFSTTGENRKGSRAATSSVTNATEWVANRKNVESMYHGKQQAIADMFNPDPSFDPAAVKNTYAAPVLDSKGGVMDYRYLMSEGNKDSLLNRNSSFEKVLGRLAGSIYDKETTKTQNRELVKMLRTQFLNRDMDTNDSYVNISPTSSNPAFRQIFKMLPKDTQQAIKETWGTDKNGDAKGMWVRIDNLNPLFGYRQLSISQLFDPDRQAKSVAEHVFVDLMTYVLGDKAQLRVRRTEAVWQELVHATKDNLVIRSFSTLKGNMISNVSVLLLHGMSPIAIVKHFRVALQGATQYRKDNAELADLQLKVAAGYAAADTAKMEHRIVELEDSIARNSAYELIKEGLLPTIVEDVSPEDDMYSYKSLFAKRVEKYTSKVNKHALTVGKTLTMAHDTKLYQAMSHATQVSDFLARYALYQHKVTHKTKPMTKKAAIQLASDTFVNYDIPSHRTLQYMNDMGLVWFTKYYLRIQKVLANLYQKEPGRVAAMMAFEKYIMNTSTILDSSVVHRLYNPLSDGALKYPGSISEIMTAKIGSGIFSGLEF